VIREHRIVAILAAALLALCCAGIATAQTRTTPCDAATPTNAVCIHWAAVTTRIDGLPTIFPVTYRVEQQTGTGAFATVSTGAATQAYVKNLAPGEYTFRVFSIENSKVSAASNAAGRSITQAAPEAPVIIIAATIRPGKEPTFRLIYTVTPRPGEVVFVAPASLRPYVVAR
jgi:predicted phage tail protein